MSLVNEALKKARIESTLRKVDCDIDLSAMAAPQRDPMQAAPQAASPVMRAVLFGAGVTLGLVLIVAAVVWIALPVKQAMGPKPANAQTVATPEPDHLAAGLAPRDQPTPKPEKTTQPEPAPESKPEPKSPEPAAPKINIEPAADPTPAPVEKPEPEAPAEPESESAQPEPEPAAPSAPALVDGRTYLQSVRIPAGPTLVMTGIAWSDSIQIALINGMTLEAGDQLESVTVVEVEPKRVALTHDGVTFYLRMP